MDGGVIHATSFRVDYHDHPSLDMRSTWLLVLKLIIHKICGSFSLVLFISDNESL